MYGLLLLNMSEYVCNKVTIPQMFGLCILNSSSGTICGRK